MLSLQPAKPTSLRQALADRSTLAAAGRDLRYWTSRRATARILPDPTDRSEVRFGTAVTIMRDDGREQTFRMVGEDEADPSQRSISHVSPLAKAMFGQRVGDVVRTGAGETEIVTPDSRYFVVRGKLCRMGLVHALQYGQ
jgi:transcription elongation GreA/GreB family factor